MRKSNFYPVSYKCHLYSEPLGPRNQTEFSGSWELRSGGAEGDLEKRSLPVGATFLVRH